MRDSEMRVSPTSRSSRTPNARAILAWIGAGSIAAACLFTLSGLLVVKDRVEITVAPSTDAASIDPVQLLRDDVAALRSDFEQLAAALEGGVGDLARTLHDSARERSDAIERRLSTIEVGLSQLIERAHDVEKSNDRDLASAPARPAGASDSPTAAATTPLAPPPILPAAPTSGEPAAGMLGFRLPGGRFEFDAAQRFQVLGSLSRVGFDAKSTLHDFTGAATGVTGEFSLNLADPAAGCHGWIEIDSGTLRTGVEGRDAEMRELLRTARAPAIRFELASLDPTEINEAARMVSGTAIGTMVIGGESRDVRVPVRLSVDESRRVTVDGEWPLVMSEFGITPPRQLGMISVEDGVRAWLAIRARAVGPAVELGKGTP